MGLNINDFIDCIETYDQARAKLEAVEAELSIALKIAPRKTRGELLARERRGVLEETELVSRWQEFYSNFSVWLESEKWSGDPPPPTSKASSESEKRAAEAAQFLLCFCTS